MKKNLLLCTLLSMCVFKFSSYSQSITLVKDLYPGDTSGLGESNYNQALEFNGILLTQGITPTTGSELYAIKNGELILIKDINPGKVGSSPTNFTLYKNKVYFTATTAANGAEVWSTDGTEAGTQLAIEVIAGANPLYGHERLIVAKNGKLYFSQDGKAYVSDGTTAGTSQIGTLTHVNFSDAGTTDSPASTTYKDGIAFVDNDRGDAVIYEHDGTTLKSLKTLTLDYFTTVYGLSEVDNGLVYATTDSFDELLKGLFFINKTTGVVTEVKDAANKSISVNRMLQVNGKAIFKTYSDAGIFATDGTSAGTVKIAPGNFTLAQLETLPHAVVGNKILFYGGGANTFKCDFYISDGTLAGTSIVATVGVPYFSRLVTSGDQVFWAGGITNGFKPEIWSANLVQKSAKKLYTLPTGSNTETDLSVLGISGDVLYLGGALGSVGREAYKLNGVPVAVEDVTIVHGNSDVLQLVAIEGGQKYFLKSEKKGSFYTVAQYDVNGSVLKSITVTDDQPFELQRDSKMSIVQVLGNKESASFKIVNIQ